MSTSNLMTITEMQQPLTDLKERFRRALSRIETAMQDSYEERESYVEHLQKYIVEQHAKQLEYMVQHHEHLVAELKLMVRHMEEIENEIRKVLGRQSKR